jgi:hypothetical protein
MEIFVNKSIKQYKTLNLTTLSFKNLNRRYKYYKYSEKEEIKN